MKVVIVGRGRVGSAFARALRGKIPARVVASSALERLGTPELVMLAVRDGAIAELGERLARRTWARTVFVHLAGAFGPEVLAPLRSRSLGVAQAHPMLSFASKRYPPRFEGASLLLRGDRVAVSRMRRVASAVGLVPRLWPDVDAVLYHAAAALAANGMVALAQGAGELFEHAGAPKSKLAKVLAPLFRSVADNVEKLGAYAALTGPIRRGDSATVERHLAAIRRSASGLEALYRASAAIQLEMVKIGPQELPVSVKKSSPVARPKKRPNRQKKS